MKIAQISPLVEAVPPQLYGGTERIVAYLTDELVAMGHEVTLFASGDSNTAARLEAGCARACGSIPTCAIMSPRWSRCSKRSRSGRTIST